MDFIFYIIGAYLCLINIITFLIYGWDKHLAKSKKGNPRIPEKNLLFLSIIGGSIGAWIAMYTFRHKTQHKKFKYGVPAIIFIQCFVFYKLLHF